MAIDRTLIEPPRFDSRHPDSRVRCAPAHALRIRPE
jgi:hypothetical protein